MNLKNQDIVIKITFFPKYMNSINCYKIITKLEYDNLLKIINEKDFFIENFFRLTKNNYNFLSKDNISIEILEENTNIIKEYINYIGNDFDLYEMILSYYDNLSDSISSISDEDLQDSVNIIKIFNYELNNKKEAVKNIINNNPHLKENEELTEFIIN